MLACIKLRYAMQLPLAAAAVNPCHVSLHLAAWAYLMFCQSLWCSCQEHSCSNSPASLSLWQLLQKLYLPTNFLMPLALGLESFPLCMLLMRLSVYLLKDPVLYLCRDGCVLWRQCVFCTGCDSLLCRSVCENSCMGLISAIIGHHLLIAACCDVLLKLGNNCIKCVCDCQCFCLMHVRVAITHTDRRAETHFMPPLSLISPRIPIQKGVLMAWF